MAEASKPGHFAPLRPLSRDELYQKQLRFQKGEPFMSVGVVDDAPTITVGGQAPLRLMFDEGRLPKRVFAPSGSHFVFRTVSSRAAVLRHYVVVATRKYGELKESKVIRDAWAGQGYRAKVFEVGTIVALRGAVLDTRARYVGIGGYRDHRRADALVNRLSQKKGLRTFVHQVMVGAPRGVIGIYDKGGKLLHRAQDALYVGTVEGGQVTVHAGTGGPKDRQQLWGHAYVVVNRHGRLALVNSVSLEALLQGLVPKEMFASAPLEALKAQAVTARGEIFSKAGHRHFAEPYHLCSEQHCQVYRGAGHERPRSNRAVRETRGLLAVRPRADPRAPLTLVDSVYSSTCGGFSEANNVVWDDAPSESLRARLDGSPHDPALKPFENGLNESNIRTWLASYPPTECGRSSFAKKSKVRWKRSLTQDALARVVKILGLGPLTDIEILGRGPGGRVTGLRFVGVKGERDVLRELPVRKLLGHLNSGAFVFDLERNPNHHITALHLTGGGWGHGVGMCQIGAIGRAERGQSFEAILAHYYHGAVVERLY